MVRSTDLDLGEVVKQSLSLEALGLLVWLSQQEKNFNVTVRSLSARHGRCKNKISQLLDELIIAGMLERSERYVDGKMRSRYLVLPTRTCPEKQDVIGIHTVKSLSKTKSKRSITIGDAKAMRPESIPLNEWNRYWEYRWAVNKPKTDQTIKLNTNVMLEAQKQGVLTDLLDSAIGNGWQGLQKKYIESIKKQASQKQAIDDQFRGVE
tara:strand:+ start:1649 stop:2272 length:624 start_codon:yes stop_codon:yes gene_type:complete